MFDKFKNLFSNNQTQKNEEAQAKMKEWVEKNRMSIQVIPEVTEHEGISYNWIKVQIKGYYFLEKENTPTIFALHILDKTFEDDEWHPVCSHLNDYTSGENRIFEMMLS